jgi:UDP-apiose/xylose synthase
VTAAELYGEGYDDSASRIPDIGKAKRLLDWQPRSSLSQMLPEIVDSYLQHYGLLQDAVTR